MLLEIARFNDVYEADLAAAFLEANGVRVSVTERFQTTVDPLMQQALGIRLMVHVSEAETARDLLARAQAGEFADPDSDEIASRFHLNRSGPSRAVGSLVALAAFGMGGFWGNSLPRRLRPFRWQGALIAMAAILLFLFVVHATTKLILDPP